MNPQSPMNPNPSEPSANPINPPANASASSRKFRSDAKLLNLPADQRDELVEWLLDGMSYKEAQQNVASTFGIEFSHPEPLILWHPSSPFST